MILPMESLEDAFEKFHLASGSWRSQKHEIVFLRLIAVDLDAINSKTKSKIAKATAAFGVAIVGIGLLLGSLLLQAEEEAGSGREQSSFCPCLRPDG